MDDNKHLYEATVQKILSGIMPEINDEILRSHDGSGYTVAHFMASSNYVFNDRDIQRLADRDDLTVAHCMALSEHLVEDEAIQKLEDGEGFSVKDMYDSVCMGKGIRLELFENNLLRSEPLRR